MLYFLDLLGVAVFAVSGALAGLRIGLDLFGVTVLAAVTAIGGGTLRDVLTDRHPVFWVADPKYLYVILLAVVVGLVGGHQLTSARTPLLVADAMGLGLFAISGAQAVEDKKHPWIVIISMGTMTGVAGGVIRDVLSGIVPMLLRKDIYATAAIAGICVYLLLQKFRMRRPLAAVLAMIFIAALRLIAVANDWQLPVLNLPRG